MKASDYIARYIEHRGISHVFELIGGMITLLIDSLHQETSVKIVSMHHEQGAGFAAEGFGRCTGLPGVAMATSGPGATNLLTAIGSCYFDSVPAVFITGQVNRHEQKGDRAIRQLGFQETDIVSMATPVTKRAWLVNDPADLPSILEEAFALAGAGRPGPVLVDIPMDVQRAEIKDLTRLDTPLTSLLVSPPDEMKIAEFWNDFIAKSALAERPMVLVGGGVHSGRALTEFRRFSGRLQIPVANSLMAVDALPCSHPLRAGLIGSYGNRWANTALSECDLLLVLGSRLDIRQTGADTENFKAQRLIYHVDCERGELNNRVKGCVILQCDLLTFFKYANDQPNIPPVNRGWAQRIEKLRLDWPDINELKEVPRINPNSFLHELSRTSKLASAFVSDVGQHQMWAAQSLDLEADQRFLTSGGMGAMGFALPAAVGACFASQLRPVVVIAGDGGFQLNIQELQTIARNQLPLKIVVINNQCHGMVRQFQESYFKGRVQSTVWGYSAPSFKAIAKSYGISAAYIDEPDQIANALAECWADPKAPFLLEVRIDLKANAYPKMAFGRSMSEMEPFVKPIEMEGT